MKPKTKILKEEYEQHYKDNKEFILENDWTKSNTPYYIYATEKSIITNMVESFETFLEEIDTDRYLKSMEKFIENFISIINIHLERIDKYKNTSTKLDDYSAEIEELNRILEENEIEKVKKVELDIKNISKKKTEEVKFISDIFNDKLKIKIKMDDMRLSSTEGPDGVSPNLFFRDEKASVLMRPIAVKNNEYIKRRTEALDIDFNAPSFNPATSNQMFINLKEKDIPPYDPNRHFFEQDKSTIEFWEEERLKIINGITIGGYKIHPFLYWHLNFFKTTIGSGQNKGIRNPNFWDNDFYFVEMLKEAEKRGNVAIFMYGTRRASKSVKMTSFTQHKLHTIPNATGSLIGFSTEDLDAILDYTKINIQNMPHAFKTELQTASVKNGIQLGLKQKNGTDKLLFGKINALNLEGGSNSGSVKTASATPDFLAIDEGGKGNLLAPWQSALASFEQESSTKWRTIPLISGTAGNENLSEDAEKILSDPEGYSILPMNYDLYDEYIDKEYQTWDRDKFGLFVPAQMSLKGPSKIKTTLGEFLGDSSPGLQKIDFYVTDWKNSNEYFKNERKKFENNPQALAAEQKNFPLTPADCLISTEYNPYPAMEAKQRKTYVEENGLEGRKVFLIKDIKGEILANNSDKEILKEYPFKGGNFDAPVVLLDELDKGEIPKFGLYVIGLDDIKHNTTSGDSVLSASMFKRGYMGGEFGNRFAGYYHTRPFLKKDAYQQLYLLMKKYNAIVNPENDDEGFVEWVEEHHPVDLYHITDGIDFATLSNMHRNSNRKYGTSTDPRNIMAMERKLQSYMKTPDKIVGEVDGLMGVQVTNDTMLLEEMYKYKPKKNADRLRSAALAYVFAAYLDKYNLHVYLGDSNYRTNRETKEDKTVVEMDVWGLKENEDDAEIQIW